MAASLGRVQPYLGRCGLADALAHRERFGGVTLQGVSGLAVARKLANAGALSGVDLDPAAYLARGQAPKPPVVAGQLGFDLDLPEFDWVREQAELGLRVVRTPGNRLRAGRLDDLKAELDRDHGVPVSVTLVLDGGWLGSKHSGALAEAVRAADRDISLVLSAPIDPVNSSYKVYALQRLLRWSVRTGRRLELLRTGPVGLPAIAAGASLAAIGLSSSTRPLGGPIARRADGVRPKRSPQVFVPRLLTWLRGVDVKRGELRACSCTASAGRGLGRFDVAYEKSVPAPVQAAARDHDSHALAQVIDAVTGSSDPRGELARRRQEAQELAADLGLVVPKWLGNWD